ncbi:hypothetical protein [Mycobacterium pseudokansasii]|uniref:Uncharacterized protein n=1 Tax=Mycobacterium pseudokansasii TaxID=2341080 RepID=A0A498QYS1_9MYCO|nr:hypothetical protein [Mycobacterium pseudokansasii]VBA55749.1 hypothetical protein LAUMK142_05235 [Mycobacterium pseudokansasii]
MTQLPRKPAPISNANRSEISPTPAQTPGAPRQRRTRNALIALGVLALSSGVTAAINATGASATTDIGRLTITFTSHDGFKLDTCTNDNSSNTISSGTDNNLTTPSTTTQDTTATTTNINTEPNIKNDPVIVDTYNEISGPTIWDDVDQNQSSGTNILIIENPELIESNKVNESSFPNYNNYDSADYNDGNLSDNPFTQENQIEPIQLNLNDVRLNVYDPNDRAWLPEMGRFDHNQIRYIEYMRAHGNVDQQLYYGLAQLVDEFGVPLDINWNAP